MVRDPATANLAAFAARLPNGLRPLTRLSYFLDAQLFGMEAGGFLATNLALHLTTVLLVFALARRRLDAAGAFCAALFFSLQPASAEVVAYVSGRSTGLMTPLLLVGLFLHDRGRRFGAFACFGLASLAKEVALVFPALLCVWEITRRVPHAGTSRVAMGAGLLAAGLGVLLLGLGNYRAMLSFSAELRSPLENLLANGRAIPLMLSLWVRPWALSPDHAFAETGHAGASVAGWLALALLASAAFAARRRHLLLTLAIGWPLIALLPTNSIVPKLDFVTEKPLYLAWIGPAIALGAGARALWAPGVGARARGWIGAGAAALLCAGLAGCLWRASLWRDPAALWLDATAKAPNKSRCWNNLGTAQLVAGRDGEAFSAFERALRLDPANEYARSNLQLARLLCGSACDSR